MKKKAVKPKNKAVKKAVNKKDIKVKLDMSFDEAIDLILTPQVKKKK